MRDDWGDETILLQDIPAYVDRLRAERDRLHRALQRQARELILVALLDAVDGEARRYNKLNRHWKHLGEREAAGWERCPSRLTWEALPDCGACGGTGWTVAMVEDVTHQMEPDDVPCPACGGSGKVKR